MSTVEPIAIEFEQPLRVAVVMQRIVLSNRWQSERWEPFAIVPDHTIDGSPQLIEEAPLCARWLHPGFRIALYRDEAEGYYLNVSAPQPYAFVKWELIDGTGVPLSVTLSYNEAARMMDGGAQVDGVPLPREMTGWLARFADAHYQPEQRKRRARPPSFQGARRDGAKESSR